MIDRCYHCGVDAEMFYHRDVNEVPSWLCEECADKWDRIEAETDRILKEFKSEGSS